MKDLSVYIHIPFCDHKCIYCDFYSLVSYDNENRFFEILKKEIRHFSGLLQDEYQIPTIFFGGGTPSFVDVAYISSVISELKQSFKFKNKVEITLETNPGTVDQKKLEQFLDAGVNRLSVGIQSFNNDELKFLTRIHNEKTAIETVNGAHQVGFENISIDLIFNLPGQSRESWTYNLEKVIELPVKHISAYSLILERGTILNKMVLDGRIKMQDEDYDADLYETTIDFFIKNNFVQYEVSNFCKRGYECRHNLAYWKHKEYLGLGPSAHSFINKKRWWNISSLKMYINSVERIGNAILNTEQLEYEQLLDEFVMLNLRGSGLDIHELNSKFGATWISKNGSYLDKLSKGNYITNSNNEIKFTKKGYLICDEILINFK